MGVTNFTQNVEDLSIGVNNILQGKIKSGFSDLGRFTINSTIGIAGFLDIATDMGLESTMKILVKALLFGVYLTDLILSYLV